MPPACAVGIGLMLAFTGLRSLGVVVFDSSTLVTLGGCPESSRSYLYSFDHEISLDEIRNNTFDYHLIQPTTVYGCSSDSVRAALGGQR